MRRDGCSTLEPRDRGSTEERPLAGSGKPCQLHEPYTDCQAAKISELCTKLGAQEDNFEEISSP